MLEEREMERKIINWEDMDKYLADPIEYRFVDYVEVQGDEA